MRRVRAYIGLGANLGDATGDDRRRGPRARGPAGRPAPRRLAPVRDRARRRRRPAARSATPSSPSTCRPVRIPRRARSTLLVALKQLERAFGRQERERWGPRELDLDLLVFGRARLSIDRPPEGVSLDPGQGRPAARRAPPRGRRAAVRPRAAGRPRAGLVPPGWTRDRRDGRRAAGCAIEGPDAVRPIATWDGDRATWTIARGR